MLCSFVEADALKGFGFDLTNAFAGDAEFVIAYSSPLCIVPDRFKAQELDMIEIKIRQEDGHLGFSYSTKGIVDHDGIDREMVYEGAVGPIPLLREALMRVCDRLETARDRRIAELSKIVDSHVLSESQRRALRKTLNDNIRARDEDREMARR